jgi:hypothetical protein
MANGDYGTSSIQWRETAPKTWTLTNTEQYGGPKPDFEAEAQRLIQQRMMEAEAMSGAGFAAADRRLAEQGAEREQLPNRKGGYRDASPQEKRVWRRQLRDFFSEAKDPRSDPLQGIQSLIDSGAIQYDEDGLWVAAPNMGNRKARQIMGMADAWADQTGLWRPRPEGGADFDPSNYRPYGEAQNRMQWETMQRR